MTKRALVLAAAIAATTMTLGTTAAIAAPISKVVRADITLACGSPMRVALRAEISLDKPLPMPSYAQFSGVLSSAGRAPEKVVSYAVFFGPATMTAVLRVPSVRHARGRFLS